MPKYCPDCNGTGADAAKTKALRKKEGNTGSHIRCWRCCGNGLDPAEYFQWSTQVPPVDHDSINDKG